ncbi:PQQ-binding-like beta-propeller repeat protein [Myxococcota bacterium]|nr:PQQ-binding-like beta-propeller repeat protein [Myxococcota bacterium]
MKSSARSLILFVLFLSSCKPLPPFHQNTMPNDSGKIAKAINKISLPSTGPANATGEPMVIFQGLNPRTAVAVAAGTGKILWKQPTPNAISRYVVAGSHVVYLDRTTGLTALDVRTGKQAWTVPMRAQHTFMGVSGAPNGKVAYVTNFKPAGDPLNQVSTLTILSEGGKEIWSLEANGRMGLPLMTNTVVVVPYRNQHLVLLDTSSPRELARILIPKGEVRFMTASSDGIFFGDKRGMYRLSPDIVDVVSRAPSTMTTDIHNVEFRYALDRYDPVTTDYSAYEVRSLLATWIRGKAGAALYENRFVIHMFKYFLGFSVNEKSQATLQWAVMHPYTEELIGSKAQKDYVFYAKADGSIECLRVATGERVWRSEPLGMRMRGVTFDIAGMTPPSTSEVEAPAPLLDALTAIANDPDSRYPLAKRLAIDALAVVGGAGVGRLIKMLTNPESSAELREKAARDLIARPDPNGVPLYLSLLQQPFDFIKSTRPLAVEVMATVLGSLKTKEAVPTMLQLLAHPATSQKELVALTEALLAIGDKGIIRPFREFLLAYRADPAFAQDIHALQKMAEALFKLGGPAERQVLVFLTEDERTLPRLREYILRMFTESRKPQPAKP